MIVTFVLYSTTSQTSSSVTFVLCPTTLQYGTKHGPFETSHHSLSHELGVSERASEQMNECIGACEQSAVRSK